MSKLVHGFLMTVNVLQHKATEHMPEQINNSIITRAKAGDESALTAIYECYKQKVQRYLHYRVGDQHVAEDLTTEVFLRVIQKLPTYQLRDIPFQSWVFQIARNLTVDYFRRQKVRNHVSLDSTVPWNGDLPDTVTARSLVSEQLSEALQKLTHGQCDVIVLRFIAEMPIAEVAQTLGKTESAVKSLQARGLEALNRIMTQEKVYYEAVP